MEGFCADKVCTGGIEISFEVFDPCELVDPCGIFDPCRKLDEMEREANGKTDSSKITFHAMYMRFVVGSRQQ